MPNLRRFVKSFVLKPKLHVDFQHFTYNILVTHELSCQDTIDALVLLEGFILME